MVALATVTAAVSGCSGGALKPADAGYDLAATGKDDVSTGVVDAEVTVDTKVVVDTGEAVDTGRIPDMGGVPDARESGEHDDSVCAYQCAAMRKANCLASLVDCESTCIKSRGGRSQCLIEDEVFRVCFAKAPTITCSPGDGIPVIIGSPCNAETVALHDCLTANGEK